MESDLKNRLFIYEQEGKKWKAVPNIKRIYKYAKK